MPFAPPVEGNGEESERPAFPVGWRGWQASERGGGGREREITSLLGVDAAGGRLVGIWVGLQVEKPSQQRSAAHHPWIHSNGEKLFPRRWGDLSLPPPFHHEQSRAKAFTSRFSRWSCQWSTAWFFVVLRRFAVKAGNARYFEIGIPQPSEESRCFLLGAEFRNSTRDRGVIRSERPAINQIARARARV